MLWAATSILAWDVRAEVIALSNNKKLRVTTRRPSQQVQELGDVGGDAPRLLFGQQVDC
jgi:hypothetical protein